MSPIVPASAETVSAEQPLDVLRMQRVHVVEGARGKE